jgi:hypothetical protein
MKQPKAVGFQKIKGVIPQNCKSQKLNNLIPFLHKDDKALLKE